MSNTLQQNLDKILEDKNTNLTSDNLKSGVTTLGITGTLEEVNNQDITVTPTTEEQTITPDEDYTGIGNVTIEAVTSDIDSNITTENIKSRSIGIRCRGYLRGRYRYFRCYRNRRSDIIRCYCLCKWRKNNRNSRYRLLLHMFKFSKKYKRLV